MRYRQPHVPKTEKPDGLSVSLSFFHIVRSRVSTLHLL
jgi:hypothetical protein